MSEEAAYDVSTFLEMVRTGVRPADTSHMVTRVEGSVCDEHQPDAVPESRKAEVSDQ